jgi:hypothetical protein
MKKSIFAVFAVILITGCATPLTTYNTNYVPYTYPTIIENKIDGKILVVMSPEQELYTIESSPSSFAGAATKTNFQVGNISKEIALSVYSGLFKEGIAFSNYFIEGYSVSITPSVTYLDYKYDQASSLGLTVTPRVKVSLDMLVLNSAGETIFKKTYYSGDTKGEPYVFNTSPHEEINKTLHKAIYNVISQSKTDLINSLK